MLRAARPVEEAALDDRVQRAREHAQQCGALSVLDSLKTAVDQSKAVMNRPLNDIFVLMSDDKFLPTAEQLIWMGLRRPGMTLYDKIRESAISKFYIVEHQNIHFAALTLDSRGLSRYGPLTVLLKTEMIEDRSSVVEKNSSDLVEDMKVSEDVPPGHLTTWERRGLLAIAKHYEEITSTTPAASFAKMLLSDRLDGQPDRFMEVHIYGTIGKGTVEKFEFQGEPTKSEQAVIQMIQDLIASKHSP